MDIYILRHGKAGVADPGTMNDSTRALTTRGREEIERIAAWMRDRDPKVTVIATSPLVRARETASIVSRITGLADRQEIWDELSLGVQPEAVVGKISRLPPESTPLLIGHEPQLSSLVSLLICGCPDCGITMKKGGIARIRRGEGELRGKLLWLLPPGVIRGRVSR